MGFGKMWKDGRGLVKGKHSVRSSPLCTPLCTYPRFCTPERVRLFRGVVDYLGDGKAHRQYRFPRSDGGLLARWSASPIHIGLTAESGTDRYEL